MTFSAGTTLGAYEILCGIGAGGFGEVYKARDTRLNRTVAIKVLSKHVSQTSESRKRFEREAQTIAGLKHPNICVLHDVGRQDGTDFLVMEYIEGETLANRLLRGALPFDQALKVASEIADALDKAHRQGITHRDLKPGNIMLTKSGSKLLDFGLAKPKSIPGLAMPSSDMPTGGGPSELTAEGTILGTLQYMSPEQLEGVEADARSDIFAFGAVVYEMLTGRKAFEGRSQSSVIAAIMSADPPGISAVQPMTPAGLERVVKMCLSKDPDERWQSAHNLQSELRWIADSGSQAGIPAPALARLRGHERVAWIGAIVFAVIAIAAAAIAFRPAVEPAEIRVEVNTPPTTDPLSLAISPDGQRLVFSALNEGKSQLWVRPMDSLAARPLVGTDAASSPFWSPDSASLGFFAEGKLKRIDISGGAPQVLANAGYGVGGTWNREGIILFPQSTSGPLFKIPATGGEPVAVTQLESGQANHKFPQFLPDGRHFVYFAQGGQQKGVYVGSLDGTSSRWLASADAGPVVSPSGFVLFLRQTTLFAQAFDLKKQELSGNPFPIAEQAAFDAGTSAAGYSATSNVVAYRTGAGVGVRQLTWLDRSGKTVGVIGSPDTDALMDPELSPDGKRVAVSRTVSGKSDVWLLDTARGVPTRFTFEAANNVHPLWSPDGSRIVFDSNRSGIYNLYARLSSGAGTDELLFQSDQNKSAADWSSDGRSLLVRSLDPQTGRNLLVLPISGDKNTSPFLMTPFEEREGQFSPDGKWIAYQSNESGRFEIYVQPFPGPGGKLPVSGNGGAQPRWNRKGRELFYISLDGKLMSVPAKSSPDGQSLETGTPVALFPIHNVGGPVFSNYKQQYAVSSDGQRFLVNLAMDQGTASPITIIYNWKPKASK